MTASTIDAAASTITDAGMKECLQETLYAAQFPAPDDGGELRVSYPFEFKASDESSRCGLKTESIVSASFFVAPGLQARGSPLGASPPPGVRKSAIAGSTDPAARPPFSSREARTDERIFRSR